MRILFSIIANAVALFATQIVPGITYHGSVVQLLVAGLILGIFNVTIRPLVMLLSLPLLIVTLGLFYFVANGILLLIASWVLPGYHVAGLIPAIVGGLVLGLVNWAMHALFEPKKD